MKKYLVIALVVLLAMVSSCQKDGVFPKEPPVVGLQVEWIPPKSFILTGETQEPCDRGFMLCGRPDAKVGDADVIVLPYDIQGVGKYTKEITMSTASRVYIRAWATLGSVENTGYSREQSFETW